MHPPQIERLANPFDLVHNARHLPKCKVVGFIRTPGAELVVPDHPKPEIGEIEKGGQILGVTAWAAM
jgi:hypothetical protein